jgi:hypothetical protein
VSAGLGGTCPRRTDDEVGQLEAGQLGKKARVARVEEARSEEDIVLQCPVRTVAYRP